MEQTWSQDVLGPDFRALSLHVGDDDEGERSATLVAYEPLGDTPRAAGGTRAVLYIHGFSDYFLHRELAQTLHDGGWAFFALDLHKHGRSLRPGQTPGFVTSLDEYDADIEAAVSALTVRLDARSAVAERGAAVGIGSRMSAHAAHHTSPPRAGVDLVLMAHSTGGLTAALWAARHPGRLRGLVLNSPWLDTQGSALLRTAAQGILDTVSRRRPKARLRLPELGFYYRSISDTRDGEWQIDPQWRPEGGFPIRAGWLAAVLAGHATLARGVSVDSPVLVLASASSTIAASWNPSMLETDSVLDVGPMVRRAAELGPEITIRRFPGALHDVFLSRGDVRGGAMDAVGRWLGQLPAGRAEPAD